MIGKLEKLVDVWTAVGESLLRKEFGETVKETPSAAVEKVKRGRKPKETTSPFEPIAPEAPKEEPAAKEEGGNDAALVKARCQEVMGLFIRRYLKASPSGLERAKAILLEVCNRPVGRLEDLTPAENLKLIPRFEAELEKAA